jgi:hypothetical protein
MKHVKAGAIAVTALTLSLCLSGCQSDENADGASGDLASAAPSTTKSPYAESIPDYIKQSGLTEAPVKRETPGAPVINFPVPPGWVDLGPDTAPWAFAAIKFVGDPAVPVNPAIAADPPTITAVLSKLSGKVEPAKVLQYAPGEMKNLPGYEGNAAGSAGKLGGFDSQQIGGTYMKAGVKRAVAQKTVVIPAKDGVFVLQVNADGTEDQKQILMDATTLIDQGTTITPAAQ